MPFFVISGRLYKFLVKSLYIIYLSVPDDIYSWHSSTVTSTPCFSRIVQQLPTTRNSDYGRMYKLKNMKKPFN